MNTENSNAASASPLNMHLLVALGLVILFHGALLPYTVGNSYDAYIHMFFGDHYARAWFDPWEPRWYTGFTTTSYPPGTHMAIGFLSQFIPLIPSFIIAMLVGLLTLVLGVYRFSLLFVNSRAAGYSALAAVFSSSIVETIHLFGQLPTIFSLGLFLNAMPHVYRWLVAGKPGQLILAVIFASATTAAHHVTTIFGTILFIGPAALYAWNAHVLIDQGWQDKTKTKIKRLLIFFTPAIRGALLAVLLIGSIATILFPYWYWSVTDPITQVSIPHGSRESFIKRLDLGLIFFVIPWGMSILVLPYVMLKAATSRMWPLAMSIFLCFVLGTGGTTPIPRLMLGGAFDILTLDRFTFWATILILPFVGLQIDSLLNGRLRHVLTSAFGQRLHAVGISAAFGATIVIAVMVATLSTFRPSQPDKIDPAPIVKFMSEDNHDHWRYLTLGFGDQFAYISALMGARSVDGNYHSARRLPELVSYAVERLENSKYLGVPGLGSLQQFIVNADRYNLKFIFSNDAFYDPLLHYSGWNRLLRLQNGIVVWEKPNVTPLPSVEARRSFPVTHKLMWGILPPLALITGYFVLFILTILRGAGQVPGEYRPITSGRPLPSDITKARIIAKVLGIASFFGLIFISSAVIRAQLHEATPEEVLEAYYDDLDFRRFYDAFKSTADDKNYDFETFLTWQRWRGGMIASYAKLTSVEFTRTSQTSQSIDVTANVLYLTPFGYMEVENIHRMVRQNGKWKVTEEPFRGYKPPQRLQSEAQASWSRAGRRKPLGDDILEDIMDRPNLSVLDARLVEEGGRYKMIGLIRNNDSDPAAVKYIGTLIDSSDGRMADEAAGNGTSHRLLPGEIGIFATEFQGVLSLEDARSKTSFDPKLYIPPILPEEPSKSTLSVSSIVNEQNLYRSIGLSAIDARHENDETKITTLATNQGTEQAELVQIQYALFDFEGRIATTGWMFLEEDLKPGQSRLVSFQLPRSRDVIQIADTEGDKILVNGRVQNNFDQRPVAENLADYIKLPDQSGFSGILLKVRTMNFRPLF